MSIKTKVLSTVLLTTIISALIVIAFFYQTANSIVERNMEIQAEDIQQSISKNLDDVVKNIDHINYLLIVDNYQLLEEGVKLPRLEKDTYESIELGRKLYKEINPLYQFQQYLMGLAVYSQNNRLVSMGLVTPLADQTFIHTTGVDSYLYRDEAKTLPSIVRPIFLKGKKVANTVAFLDVHAFLEAELAKLPAGSYLALSTKKKEPLLGLGSLKKGQAVHATRYFSKDASMWLELKLPREQFQGDLLANVRRIIILAVIVVLLGIIISLGILMKITGKIHVLSEAMNRVKNKQLDTQVAITGGDELADMGATFNSMVTNINHLMDENQAKEKEKKEIEMDFLQAQINPHFLSNTLNSMIWMADLQEANNISSLGRSLVDLLQSSMYQGKDLISLREELQHIKSYVHLEQVAYTDNFEVYYDVSESLQDLKILRFILQPLVENSILHNFVNENDKTGEIIIAAEIEHDQLLITITDNGKGLDNTPIYKKTTKRISSKRYNRIGVKNIDQRIKLYFGDQYGLSYRSEKGVYTKVTITLPVLRTIS